MRRRLGRTRKKRLGKTRITIPRAICNGKHYVYKITVNDKYYIGYSSRPVLVRVKEHLREARKGVRNYFYNALRKYNYLYDICVLAEFDEEYWGLVREMELIKENSKGLNCSPGGEGKTMRIESYIDGNGGTQYRIKN